MIYVVVLVLWYNFELVVVYELLLISCEYDLELKLVIMKVGIIVGMLMIEKQGGFDVCVGIIQVILNVDGSYSLIGYKWFILVLMCDIFLVFVQVLDGLLCFLLLWVLFDGICN